jgi:hypothetical protein
MVDPSVERAKPGLDINAVYSPAAAATDVERPESSEEAALGRSGANGLLAVTILELIGTTVIFFVVSPTAPHPVEMAFAYGIVAIFAALYVWARSNPYPACITGLCLYIAIHLLAAVGDPTSLYKGLIVKVIVIGVLVSSIRNIQRYRATARQ